MELEEIIKKCEDALSQLKYAEKALNQCNEICEAYFTYGYRNEGNNIRYSTIKKIIETYYTKKEKIMRVEDTELDLVEINQFNPNLDEYAERALLGPQADILQSIENVNARYNLKLKCTKTFRWSPGAFEQIKKLI